MTGRSAIAEDDPRWRPRQFLLGPPGPVVRETWQRRSLAADLLLQAHPDLSLAHVDSGRVGLTLLGFAIDPENPRSSDEEILQELARHDDPGTIVDGTARFGGRWALVIVRGDVRLVLTDPTGLRQVFHTVGTSERWCASQAGLIAETVGLPIDPPAASFISSLYFRSYREPWWPADTSPYRDVRRLMPNHVLDLRTGETRRFWPVDPVREAPLEAAVLEGGRLLRGLLQGAAHRQPLALGLTAGIDSRTVLAAARDARSDLRCYTIDPESLGTPQADVDVPARLCTRLGVEHLVVRDNAPADSAFGTIYCESFDTPHGSWARTAQELAATLRPEWLSVTGSCSEIARGPERWSTSPSVLTPESLTAFANMDMDATGFARAALGRWLGETDPIAERSGYHILTLFYWENRLGSWLAAAQAEWDIVHDTYSPFDCRRLLEVLLATDPRERMTPEYRLHHELIRTLWPEALSEPINPQTWPLRLRTDAKTSAFRFLRASRMYRAVMAAYLRLRSRRLERL